MDSKCTPPHPNFRYTVISSLFSEIRQNMKKMQLKFQPQIHPFISNVVSVYVCVNIN